MNKHILTNGSISLALGFSAFGLLFFPVEVSQSIREGLSLCINTLLPTLFPFFILSALVIKLGFCQSISRLCAPIMGPLFCLSGRCAGPVILGCLGGCPTGAKAVVTMYQEGQCTKSEAQRLLSFCVNCGPAFLIGTVGCGHFGGMEYGLLLMAVHILSALSTGIILSHQQSSLHQLTQYTPRSPAASFCSAFTESVTQSLRAFFDLSAFVLCFSAITQLLTLVNAPVLFCKLFPCLTNSDAASLFLGFFEMTQGILSLNIHDLKLQLVLAALLSGWGGLSIHCQVLAILQDTDLSPNSYLQGKSLHAVLSTVWMAAILHGPEWLCLLGGFTLSYLLFRIVKKEVVKSSRVLYNGSNKTRDV